MNIDKNIFNNTIDKKYFYSIIKITNIFFKELCMYQVRRIRTERIRAIFLMGILLLSASLCFADMTPNYSETVKDIGGLSEVLNQILGFFRSNYMKAIVSIALGGLAVGMIMNRGEPGMVKKFIPWIAGCTLLLSLSAIVDIIFKTSGN
jgi:hypothetical protein